MVPGSPSPGPLNRECCDARAAVDRDRHMRIAQGVGFDRSLDRRERDAHAGRWAVARRRQRQRALSHRRGELRRFGDRIDQAPGQRLLAANAFAGGAEDIRQVVADMALVGQPRQAAGAGQHAEQRHLGQADRARTIVDEKDLVAGQRQFVAAAGAGAVDGGEELQPLVLRRVFEAVAGLVGEFAEVDLPRMAREAEHEDVGAGAEHPLAGARDDHDADLGMLETDAVDSVIELDVDAEIVAVELELVAGTQARVLVEIGEQRRDRPVELELPVPVERRRGLIVDPVHCAPAR